MGLLFIYYVPILFFFLLYKICLISFSSYYCFYALVSIMSNLVKLEFATLNKMGKHYLSWVLDAKIHLDSKQLEDTIKKEKQAFNQDKAKAMIFCIITSMKD